MLDLTKKVSSIISERLRKSADDRHATPPPSSIPFNQKTQLYKRSAVRLYDLLGFLDETVAKSIKLAMPLLSIID